MTKPKQDVTIKENSLEMVQFNLSSPYVSTLPYLPGQTYECSNVSFIAQNCVNPPLVMRISANGLPNGDDRAADVTYCNLPYSFTHHVLPAHICLTGSTHQQKYHLHTSETIIYSISLP